MSTISLTCFLRVLMHIDCHTSPVRQKQKSYFWVRKIKPDSLNASPFTRHYEPMEKITLFINTYYIPSYAHLTHFYIRYHLCGSIDIKSWFSGLSFFHFIYQGINAITCFSPSSELILVGAEVNQNSLNLSIFDLLYFSNAIKRVLAGRASAILEWFSAVVASTFKDNSAFPTLMRAWDISLQVHFGLG